MFVSFSIISYLPKKSFLLLSYFSHFFSVGPMIHKLDFHIDCLLIFHSPYLFLSFSMIPFLSCNLPKKFQLLSSFPRVFSTGSRLYKLDLRKNCHLIQYLSCGRFFLHPLSYPLLSSYEYFIAAIILPSCFFCRTQYSQSSSS